MSKVAIEGNALGTGTLTIAAPNTNTNRTITLPDNTGTILTTATADSSIPGNGNLTVAEQWFLTTNITGTNAVISSNLSLFTTGAAGNLNPGMTESSGIFTFPSTGYWLVSYTASFANISAGSPDRVSVDLEATVNNSTFVALCATESAIDGTSGGAAASASQQVIIDVADTANVKVLFKTRSFNGTSVLVGNATERFTSFTFIRLGDI